MKQKKLNLNVNVSVMAPLFSIFSMMKIELHVHLEYHHRR
jgi:hypothetical protein